MVDKNKKLYRFNKQNSGKNPFKKEEKPNNLFQKLGIFIIILSIFLMFKIVFTNAFFKIKMIEINGLKRVPQTDVIDAVRGIMDYKKFFLLPGDNYFLVDVKELKNILTDRFPIEKIVVEKHFPNKIIISLEEKISTIIYDNGKNYSYIDLDGRVVEVERNIDDSEWIIETAINTTTDEFGEDTEEEIKIYKEHIIISDEIKKEMGDYPIIYDKRGVVTEINKEVLQKDTIVGVLNWYNYINNYTKIGFDYVILENELGSALIKTKEGWGLNIALNDHIENQFDELIVLLEKEIRDRSKLNYIDLRYRGRAYWR